MGECGQMAARSCRESSHRGVFPSGLECLLEVIAHPRGGVGAKAAHAGDFVAEAPLGEDLGDAVSAIQDLWPCLRPCTVRPGLIGSQQASGVSSGMAGMPRPAGALGVVQVARRVVLTASARRLPAATAAALLLGGQALLVIAGEAATSPGRRRGLARGHGQLHARVPRRRRVLAHRRAAAPGGRPRPPPGRGQLAGGWREQRGHAFQWPGHQPARRISHTVDGATITPSFASSPWIRRCPHSGFSLASRTTRRPTSGAVDGRPGLRRWLVSYLRPASLRCQARSVAGVRERRWSSACSAGPVPAQRTTPGRPARTVSGRHSGAAPRSRAGVRAVRHLSPGHRGTPGWPSRAPGVSAGRQS